MFWHSQVFLGYASKQRPHLCSYLTVQKEVLVVSKASLQSRHLDVTLMAIFCNASRVRQLLLATNQVKHFTLVGATFFHIMLQGDVDIPALPPPHKLRSLFQKRSHLNDILKKKNLSGSMVVPGDPLIKLKSSTLSTS